MVICFLPYSIYEDMKMLFITQVWDENDSVLGFVPSWAAALAAISDKLSVVALRVSWRQRFPSIPVYSLGKEHGASRMREIIFFFTLVFRLRREYDTVFVHMNPEYIILAGWWWLLSEKRIVLWYAHGSVTWKLYLAAPFCHRILTSTPEGCRISSSKIRVVGQAIDTDLFQSISNQKTELLRLVVVGRISPSKGQQVAIETLEKLRADGIDIYLDIIGAPIYESDRQYQKECEQYISDHKLSAYVNFMGPRDRTELAKILPSMTLCLNMSTTGSLDKAGLEAMAAGVPVITGNEAFRSSLEPYTSLFFISTGKSDDIIKAVLKYLALSAIERERVRVNLRENVITRHSIATFAERVIDAL